jgi:hypothetical protein
MITSPDMLALDLVKEMERQKISSAEMAKRMKTSRSAVRRLLDPTYAGTTVKTLRRVAIAMGYKMEIRLVRASP